MDSAQGRPGAREGFRIIKFKGVNDRDEAAALRGSKVYVRDLDVAAADREAAAAQQNAAQGPDAAQDYYVHQLVGLRVLLPEHDLECLGTVVGVVTRDQLSADPSLGQDLLEIRIEGGVGGGEGDEAELAEAAEAAAGERAEEAAALGVVTEGEEEEEEEVEVDLEAALRLLVPFVPAIVPRVDLEGRTLHFIPPPGLLDLAAPPPKEKVVIRGLLPLWGESAFWLLSEAEQLKATQ